MRQVETAPDPALQADPAATVTTEQEGRRKPRTSRRLREVQRWERRTSKALHRLARAAERGVARYREERDRSADERRDGALLDLPVNLAEGMAETVRAASRVPVDLARGLRGRRALRAARAGARLMLLPFVR